MSIKKYLPRRRAGKKVQKSTKKNFRNKSLEPGISIRKRQVWDWLKERKFRGEYLLVSTKPDSIYSRKLAALKIGQKLVVDLYTPILLEKELTLSKWKPVDLYQRWKNRQIVKQFLERGNHFLVANHRQKEYWLKTARQLGILLNEKNISVLPTGAGKITDYVRQPAERITDYAERKVMLWFGGIYPWMDPAPLIKAFSKLAVQFPNWKLRILGGFHPETGYIKKYQRIVDLAKKLIPKKQLEIIPWQSTAKLSKYFDDVAVAVHLVKQTPEDYYAHRVRLLTLLEAGIPIITGGRDVISELIDETKSGIKIVCPEIKLTDRLKTVITDSKILDIWKLHTPLVWKLLKKREFVPVKWQKILNGRINDY